MAILTTDYSFNEVTKPAALKHGDKIKYNSGGLGDGWRKLTDAPAGTVLRSPKGDIIIRVGKADYPKVTTYYSHNGVNHTFQDGTYTVLDVPAVEENKPDPTGDLAVKLALMKVNGGRSAGSLFWKERDVEWARKDKEWRALAEFILQDYVKVGTKALVDSYGDLWFQTKNGKFRLGTGVSEGTRDRDYIRREFGIKTEIVVE